MKYYSFILIIAFFVSCGRFANEGSDDKKGKRIVCIAKQYTEIIFALGAQDELVAVDVSSTYPPAAKKLRTVGYHRALSLEAILSEKPDLVIHDNNIGPEHVVKQLNTLAVPQLTFNNHSATRSGTDSLIREMGEYFHRERQADSICNKLDREFEMAVVKPDENTVRPKVCVIHYGQASNVYLTMTKKSTASRIIDWAGGAIELDGEKGMMPLSAEVIAKSDPDIILLTDFGYDRINNLEKIKQLPGIQNTRAAKNNRIYRVEEHDLVYLGPRTGENIAILKKILNAKKAGNQ